MNRPGGGGGGGRGGGGEGGGKKKKDDRWMNLRKINVHEKVSYLLVLLLFLSRISLQLVRVLVSRHHLGSTLF